MVKNWTGLSTVAMNPLEFAIKTWQRLKVNDRRQRLRRFQAKLVDESTVFNFLLFFRGYEDWKCRGPIDETTDQKTNTCHTCNKNIKGPVVHQHHTFNKNCQSVMEVKSLFEPKH